MTAARRRAVRVGVALVAVDVAIAIAVYRTGGLVATLLALGAAGVVATLTVRLVRGGWWR